MPECAAYLFNLGSTRLLGLIPDKNFEGKRKIVVRFEGKASVYDVRRKEFLGSEDRFEATIEPAVPRLFAMVAGPVRGIETASAGAKDRGDEISMEFRVLAGPGLRSVAKVEVFDPSGKSAAHYGRNVDVVDGHGRFSFRTALNDIAGVWKVVVTDVLSGRKATVEAVVR